ncbi:hypothetical protein MHU86_19335 [Fragilaria crotonensis]|nr:hypothetical protein MHU86_19335 [Fragilaria crotonensis]
MAMSTTKFSGSAKVLKELQGFAGFVAYEACCMSDAMTSATMENQMEEHYFGDPTDSDSIGLADQLVRGLGIFAGLYNEEFLQNSVVGASVGRGGGENLLRSPTPTGLVLVMKPELHCLGEDKKIVVGGTNGLKLSTMLASGLTDKAFDSGIKGRTLLIRSKDILKNCKKALAVVLRHDSPYKSYASTGLLPSGMCIEDYFLYVRQKMYVALSPRASSTTANSSRNNKKNNKVGEGESKTRASAGDASVDLCNQETANASADLGYTEEAVAGASSADAALLMPVNYVFPGFLVFALLGPIVHPDMRHFQSHLIMTQPKGNSCTSGGHDSSGSVSVSKRKRSATEEKKLNKKVEVKQEAGSATDSSMHRSGNQQGTSASNDYTINQQLQIAAMAQSKIVINNRERSDLSDRIVAMHTSKVAGKKVLIEELKFMIMNTSSDDPDRAVYMKDLKVLHRELGSALDELLQSEQSIIDAASKTLQLKQQAIAVASSPRSTKEGFHKLYNNVLVDLTISSPAASTSVFTATPNCNSRINGGDDNNDVADNVAAS